MTNSTYANLSFTAFSEDELLIREILKNIPTSHPSRFLDLGCGTGENVFKLAEHYPDSKFIGVDISTVNIKQAQATISINNQRISFQSCDYLKLDSGLFDVIYAESVLHLIPASDECLYEKISNDVRHKGTLIVTMPYDCYYNRFLILLRKLGKKIRHRYIDKLILFVAKLVYPSIDEKILIDRIPYMYIVPYRMDSEVLRKKLEKQYHLKVIQSISCKSPSIAKLKHKLLVFRKM